MIEQSVRMHDRHQVELKLAYAPGEFEKSKAYDLSLYFFLPASLGITPATYTKRDFFSDLIGHIRIKTPSVLLRDMASGTSSPLKKLEAALLEASQRRDKRSTAEAERQLRMFCCILKSALRDHLGALRRRPSAKDQRDLVEQFLSCTANIARAFWGLRSLVNAAAHSEAFTKYQFADEYVSLIIEANAFDMLETLKAQGNGEFKEFKPRLLALVQSQIAYRTETGYPSIPNASGDNETLVFRKSVLKKYIESVLFLIARTKREGTLAEQTIFAAAAGLSMVFATGVAFIGQRTYGNLTLPFFVALVISYMFKDRIKELLRKFLNTKVRRFFFDRRQMIFSDSSHGDPIAVCRESFDFAQDSRLPASVWRLRSRDHITEIENGWVGETVLMYRKRITLLPSWFRKAQVDYRVDGVNDILRFNISNFLPRMDEPRKPLWFSDGSDYREIDGQRVYHLNLIVRCRSGRASDEQRIRVVLNKEGIKRIEPVNGERTVLKEPTPDADEDVLSTTG